MENIIRTFGQNFFINWTKFSERNAIYINEKYYSYRELYERAVYISGLIQSSTLTENNRIAILCYKDIDTYAAIIAISALGKSFVPVSTKSPLSRNKTLLKKGAVNILLSAEYNEDIQSYYRQEDVIICFTKNEVEGKPIVPGNYSGEKYLKAEEAYLMFTSGSTGEPKGVPVSVLNLDHFIDVMLNSESYRFNENDRFLQMFDLTFDASLMCLCVPLSIGACLYIPADGPAYLKSIELIDEKKLTVSLMVPSSLNYLEPFLDEITLPSLRYSFFGGEALPARAMNKWISCVPNAIISNLYGPTEATIWCSNYIIERAAIKTGDTLVPIGKLFPGMEYVLLDENLPAANTGELCLCGPQVIKNYLDEGFPESFVLIKGKKYYRTGDLVKLDANENLVFIGRTDNQVKFNGFRINLEEIEQNITHITRSSCAVIMHHRGEFPELIAFIKDFEDFDFLKQRLLSALPQYMIPGLFTSVPELPMTVNGKVDRKKLAYNES